MVAGGSKAHALSIAKLVATNWAGAASGQFRLSGQLTKQKRNLSMGELALLPADTKV